MNDKWQDDVRVHYDQPVAYLEQSKRSDAQKVQDTIIEEAAAAATEAKTQLEAALEWMAVITPSKHRNLVVEVGQFIEEIEELKRIRQ